MTFFVIMNERDEVAFIVSMKGSCAHCMNETPIARGYPPLIKPPLPPLLCTLCTHQLLTSNTPLHDRPPPS